MSENCPSDEIHCTCVPVLRREVARLREILEFYGEKNNHLRQGYGDKGERELNSPVEKDFGERARKVLEETNESK